MGIDASIYQNQRPVQMPSMIDSASKAMTLSQLAMQQRKLQSEQDDQDAVKGAFSRNVGPDGQVNRAGVLSELAKTSPMQAMTYQGKFADMDKSQADAKQQVLKDKINQMGLASNLAMSAKDQPSYEKMIQQIQGMGMDTSHMPQQFDPGLMRQYATMSLDQKERLEGMVKGSEMDISQQKAPLERGKIAAETRHLDAETGKVESETIKRNPLADVGNDPAKLVPGRVPKEHQAAVFKEIDAAENTRHMSKEIMDSFDQAVQDSSGAGAVTSYLKEPRSVQALHQALQPTFKDLEGTVRQAAMDNTFKNISPAGTDTAADIATKRRALEEYLQSKASAPVARGFNIDLSQFDSTAPYKPSKGVTGVADNGTGLVGRNAIAAEPPRHGTVDSGYVFMGGNPAERKNWKKQ